MTMEIRQTGFSFACDDCERIIEAGCLYYYTRGFRAYWRCIDCAIKKYNIKRSKFETFRPNVKTLLSFHSALSKCKITLRLLV